ncbi:ABC transporter substrate-binding protein [Parerythrobacter jejuensis]|uniref:Peptide ABC transporter substrate-binding protein n=1 Tax=Parerythrobacter jejuensis TaxID=795812 RepID=A0A845AW40_9SPHN|nr:ABC transporter substrate-binding protein [Parerythrobacter jejuensis]MXP30737.1 peptide ABC transporter substrate-binding protein [Parerythrobacter jejuensis]MXP33497.1 peptide ABC transporter substrate-binding protein [Parerythrobacter jejuensis]
MRRAVAFTLSACILLAGCNSRADDGTVSIAVIGEQGALFDSDMRLAYAGQLTREATTEGLVSIDAQGEVVPAIAERWIVTDDGLSFIFRLRGSDWTNGEPITANSVRQALLRNIRDLRGTSLGLDLAKIDEIRAMTARVIEIRLKSPMPEFLQLLSQPELGLRRVGSGVGPFTLEREGEAALLTAVPPQARGLPEQPDWADQVLAVRVRAMAAPAAVEAFSNGEVEAVVNGRISSLPLADTGPLSRGTVRLDAALGVFGLSFSNARGLLASAERREALSMAIDRSTLLQPFNVAGWIPTTRIVSPALPGAPSLLAERWFGQSLDQRRATAASRINAWTASGGSNTLQILLPEGPGSDILLSELADDFSVIGVTLERAENAEAADLVLVDRLARYASPRWFLNQFNCDLSQPLCSPDADVLIDQSLDAATVGEATTLLAEAEGALTAAEAFIPLGAPIRWSLVRGGLDGFSENQWARHPLFPFAIAPIS